MQATKEVEPIKNGVVVPVEDTQQESFFYWLKDKPGACYEQYLAEQVEDAFWNRPISIKPPAYHRIPRKLKKQLKKENAKILSRLSWPDEEIKKIANRVSILPN
jgi:hypothetical protein